MKGPRLSIAVEVAAGLARPVDAPAIVVIGNLAEIAAGLAS